MTAERPIEGEEEIRDLFAEHGLAGAEELAAVREWFSFGGHAIEAKEVDPTWGAAFSKNPALAKVEQGLDFGAPLDVSCRSFRALVEIMYMDGISREDQIDVARTLEGYIGFLAESYGYPDFDSPLEEPEIRLVNDIGAKCEWKPRFDPQPEAA